MPKHIVMSIEEDGASRLETLEAPALSADGLPEGWQGRALEDSGIFMFQFEIAPGAVEFPVHADGAEWLAYVISGSGTLYAGTAAMERTTRVEYGSGDYITFRANTPHGWKNNGEEGRILFVKRSE